MPLGRFRKTGPDNYYRSEATKRLESCEHAIRTAFRDLASAGVPRAPKPHRAKYIESAQRGFDLARAHNTDARYHFAGCKRRLEERVADKRDEPHDRAAVTFLEPMIRNTSAEVETLRRLVLGYGGGKCPRPNHSEERRVADRLGSSFLANDGIQQRCNWCAGVERFGSHYSLDRDGYVIKRAKAVRFCCLMCFIDGRDLAEPAPPALPPALPLDREPEAETVECVAVDQPLLPLAEIEAQDGTDGP